MLSLKISPNLPHNPTDSEVYNLEFAAPRLAFAIRFFLNEMWNVCRRSRKQFGLTLVELLVVVAIIGTLTILGVPTYIKLVGRSRQAEAKINLATIATAEDGFYSEFGAYGNNLHFLGADEVAPNDSLRYAIGFGVGPDGCGLVTTLNIAPSLTSSAGGNISNQNLSYYIGYTAAACAAPWNCNNYSSCAALTTGTTACFPSIMGRLTLSICGGVPLEPF